MDYLVIDKIKKRYDSNVVFENISLSFNLNEIVFIVGNSGSGKSTLLNCIGLISDVTSGNIYLNGKKIKKNKTDNFRYNYFSYIYQDNHLLPYFSIKENIELDKNMPEEEIKEFLDNLGVKKEINSQVITLSGGEKQRIAAARCFLKKPKIILADEPTASLDSDNADKLIKLLVNNAEGKLLIITTHNMELAKKYATRIIYIENGQISDKILKPSSKLINRSEKNKNYKPISIKKSLKHLFLFMKGKIKPLVGISFMSALITALLMIIVGIKSGVDNYIKMEEKIRLDTRYYSFTNVKEENEIVQYLKLNGIKFKEYDNYEYVLNNLVKRDLNIINNIDFNYEISVIDFNNLPIKYDGQVIINSLFYNKFKEKSFIFDSFFEIYGSNFTIKNTAKISKLINESNLYNNPKIYFNYDYIKDIIPEKLMNELKAKLNIPKIIYCVSDTNSLQELLTNDHKFISYIDYETSTSTDCDYIYYSSNLVFKNVLSTLASSLYKIMSLVFILLFISTLFLQIISLKNITINRNKEFALKLSFGEKEKDIKNEIGIQSLLFSILPLFISISIYLIVYIISKYTSGSVLKILYKASIIEFDTVSILLGLYISLITYTFLFYSNKTYIFNTNIMEELKND